MNASGHMQASRRGPSAAAPPATRPVTRIVCRVRVSDWFKQAQAMRSICQGWRGGGGESGPMLVRGSLLGCAAQATARAPEGEGGGGVQAGQAGGEQTERGGGGKQGTRGIKGTAAVGGGTLSAQCSRYRVAWGGGEGGAQGEHGRRTMGGGGCSEGYRGVVGCLFGRGGGGEGGSGCKLVV